MRIHPACIPCFVKQALEATAIVSDDPDLQEGVLRGVMGLLAAAAWDEAPPALAGRVHAEIRRRVGDPDPYETIKSAYNRFALGLYPGMRRRVETAADPTAMALQLVMAANVIDFGVDAHLSEAGVRRTLDEALAVPLDGDVAAFEAAVAAADRILYLADNAGELVFDRLLIELLPTERVTLAVRGGAIINDVTRTDAAAVGLADAVRVIDNGDDSPGTVLERCGPAFREAFAAADLIIAKGQGNYESLDEADAPICFLLRVKCQVVAELTGRPVGTQVMALNGRATALAGERSADPAPS